MQDFSKTPARKVSGERRGSILHLPAELLAELQRSLEDRLGKKSSEFFYSAAEVWAIAEGRKLRAALADDAMDLAEAFCHSSSERGWGQWHLEKFDPGAGLLRILVAESPIARCYGESDEPVCHLFCGAVAGLAQTLLGMPVNASELMCAARGENHCLFEARALSEIREETWQW